MVITHDRPEFLKSRTVTSIIRQTSPFERIILVDDSEIKANQKSTQKLLKQNFPKKSIYVINQKTPGAAGAWNTGIEWIYNQNPEAWIAFLDDDDEWEDDHLETCIKYSHNQDAVINGIKVRKDGDIVAENLPQSLSIQDFFAGNPGWQGSNTFINAKCIKEIGGFDENLLCTHDRDLAVRCLSNPAFRYSMTNACTAIYNLESDRTSLTIPHNHGKKTGLLQFYQKHKSLMNEKDKHEFKKRALNYFNVPPQLFDLLEFKTEYKGFQHSPVSHAQGISKIVQKIKYGLRKTWSEIRMRNWITRIIGPQFSPDLQQIEIDITYRCNLRCKNCNRSCRQAPSDLELSLQKIQEFVKDSIENRIIWKRIRILGGEPTLHSQFEEILYAIIQYKLYSPHTRLEVVTNGFGKQVQRQLLKVPPMFHIENSNKKKTIQPSFIPFNLAPQDFKKYKHVDYRNGCSNLNKCGIGLTPLGYYPCALAGGIDRIVGWDLGLDHLPLQKKDLIRLLEHICPYCGRFQSRIFIPYDLRKPLEQEQISPTWQTLYQSWRNNKEETNEG